MRTLQDIIDAGEAEPYMSRLVEGGADGSVARFRCRCGRLVPPDMMLEVQPPGCDDDLAGVCGRDRFRCDGCWTGWVMRGQVCPDRLRELTGQPDRAEGQPW